MEFFYFDHISQYSIDKYSFNGTNEYFYITTIRTTYQRILIFLIKIVL
jgi:hypothetical protein